MYKVIWTEDKKERAIELISNYLSKYGPGECIAQGDNALIEAPEVMCEIADDILLEDEGLVYEED